LSVIASDGYIDSIGTIPREVCLNPGFAFGIWLLAQMTFETAREADDSPDDRVGDIRVLVVIGDGDAALRESFSGIDAPEISVSEVARERCDEACAKALAHAHGAQVVIWSADDPASRTLYCYATVRDGYTLNVRTFDSAPASSIALIQSEIIRGWLEAVRRERAADRHVPRERPPDQGARPAHPEFDAPNAQGAAAPPLKNEVEERPGRLLLGAGYTFAAQSADHPAVHGVALSLGGRVFDELYLFLSYLFTFPTRDDVMGIRLELRQHPIWVGAGFAHPLGRFSLGAQLALAIVYVSKTADIPAPLSPEGGGGKLQIAIVPLFTTAVKVAGPLSCFLFVGADMYIFQARYFAKIDGDPLEIHKEWPVQPRIVLGATVAFF
jgi:hypothetical protein